MKTLGIYFNINKLGDAQAFFDGDELITVIDGNDGQYRDEYMNCLFENFGIKVLHLKKLNKKQLSQLPQLD